MQETVDGKSINLRRKLFEQKERKQKISNPHPLHLREQIRGHPIHYRIEKDIFVLKNKIFLKLMNVMVSIQRLQFVRRV